MSGKKSRENSRGAKIAQAILAEYHPATVKEMEEVMKDILGPMMEEILLGEMDNHLGYQAGTHVGEETENRRNGYIHKKVKSSYGEIPIQVPRDREATFEPQLVPKRTRDVSGIEEKVLAMYARGLSERDIAATIDDLYGFELSAEHISNITNRVMEQAREWQDRPLKKFYTFLFVDCIYVTVRKDYETKNHAVYVILGYDVNGVKDILGLWMSESEGKHQWMQIFDELKSRGVEDVLFLCMDGVSGLEDGAKAIFPEVVVQRCIVHMIRNSIKYIPTKEYKRFTAHLKCIYGAVSLNAAKAEFERFQQEWSGYPGAVDVWRRNWAHVEQLFQYGTAVRKVMYTTNAIESVNSSFRKVLKKGAFPGVDSVMKVLYLRITELYRKWNGRPVMGWAMVRNQLAVIDSMQNRILKYENI